MKVCIFDLDGTLTDTLESLAYSVNLTLRQMNLPEISREDTRNYVGNGARVLMTKSLKKAGDENALRIDEAMEIYSRVFGEHCMYQVKPYPGILDLIKELKLRNVKLAVLSNKQNQQAKDVVEQVFGKGVFDFVQGQREDFPRKPDPAGVLEILSFFGEGPEECLYVGDSEVDVLTGYNAKVMTLAATWGFRSEQVLIDAGAEHMIHSPMEVIRYL